MSENKKELAEYIHSIDTWVDKADEVKELLKGADDQSLVTLLEAVNTSSTKSWVIESDILRYIHDSVGEYGNKAVKLVAQTLGMSRSYCFALLKINKEIFDKAEDLRKTPNLKIGHFVNVVNNLSKIQDPVALLRRASDEEWRVSDLTAHLKGREVTRNYTLQYYKIEPTTEVNERTEWSESKTLSPKVNVVKDARGNEYIEIKIYNNRTANQNES